jgi:hypothetical protein
MAPGIAAVALLATVDVPFTILLAIDGFAGVLGVGAKGALVGVAPPGVTLVKVCADVGRPLILLTESLAA